MNSPSVLHTARVLCFSLLAITLTSCGNSGPKLYPVTGKVTYNGTVPEGASVTLLPSSGTIDADTLRPSGTVTADGTFTLSTYFGPDDLRKGAPPGQHVALIAWYGNPAEGEGRASLDQKNANRLPRMYNDKDKSPLKIEVKEESNDLEPFTLESKIKNKK